MKTIFQLSPFPFSLTPFTHSNSLWHFIKQYNYNNNTIYHSLSQLSRFIFEDPFPLKKLRRIRIRIEENRESSRIGFASAIDGCREGGASVVVAVSDVDSDSALFFRSKRRGVPHATQQIVTGPKQIELEAREFRQTLQRFNLESPRSNLQQWPNLQTLPQQPRASRHDFPVPRQLYQPPSS